jgi:hypothetical protein
MLFVWHDKLVGEIMSGQHGEVFCPVTVSSVHITEQHDFQLVLSGMEHRECY